jgi:hypothetical protein
MTKAYLIKPKDKVVMTVDFDNSLRGPKGFYKLLECDHIEMFSTHFPKQDHYFYCDGEALLKDIPPEEKYHTWFKGAAMGVQGNVLVLGPMDDEGDHLDVTCTLGDVDRYIDKFDSGHQDIPPVTIMELGD